MRARDSQGNVDRNTVERSVTLSCDAPEIVVRDFGLTEVSGCDADGRPDGGEVLTLSVTLENASGTHAQGVSATLRSLSGNVLVLAGPGELRRSRRRSTSRAAPRPSR